MGFAGIPVTIVVGSECVHSCFVEYVKQHGAGDNPESVDAPWIMLDLDKRIKWGKVAESSCNTKNACSDPQLSQCVSELVEKIEAGSTRVYVYASDAGKAVVFGQFLAEVVNAATNDQRTRIYNANVFNLLDAYGTIGEWSDVEEMSQHALDWHDKTWCMIAGGPTTEKRIF